jgi:hypothetical protein
MDPVFVLSGLFLLVQLLLDPEVEKDHAYARTEVQCGKENQQIGEKSPACILDRMDGKIGEQHPKKNVNHAGEQG